MNLSQDAKITILLADGAPAVLDLEKSFFRRGDYEVLFASDAQQVYETAITHQPNIIFMGFNLDEMPGDELCLRFKAHPDIGQIPLVLVAEPNRADELLRCQRAGCDDLLLKPPRRHQFLQAVEKHLNVPRRAAPRVEARMHVTYREPSGEQNLTDFAINVSTGGVFIETGAPLPVATPLSLEFIIPGYADPIRCRGRVAWVNDAGNPQNRRLPPGMGLQFLDLNLEDMAVIRSFVLRSLVVPEW